MSLRSFSLVPHNLQLSRRATADSHCVEIDSRHESYSSLPPAPTPTHRIDSQRQDPRGDSLCPERARAKRRRISSIFKGIGKNDDFARVRDSEDAQPTSAIGRPCRRLVYPLHSLRIRQGQIESDSCCRYAVGHLYSPRTESAGQHCYRAERGDSSLAISWARSEITESAQDSRVGPRHARGEGRLSQMYVNLSLPRIEQLLTRFVGRRGFPRIARETQGGHHERGFDRLGCRLLAALYRMARLFFVALLANFIVVSPLFFLLLPASVLCGPSTSLSAREQTQQSRKDTIAFLRLHQKCRCDFFDRSCYEIHAVRSRRRHRRRR